MIFYDPQRVLAQMGERMTVFRDYQVELAKQSTVRAANLALLRTLGTKRVPDDELRRIAVPVSLVWGRHDRVMKFGIAEKASRKFGWPLYPIEDAGHIPVAEQPAAFGEALRTILSE